MAVEEERALSETYRQTKKVRRPEGQGLNDLYVRFFRMAERRIAEKTGQGIVCFISNYSWLDGLVVHRHEGALSTGVRRHSRIDNLHGDKYIISAISRLTAPRTSETIFCAARTVDPVGIKVGTAIALLVRKADQTPRRRTSTSDTEISGARQEREES